MSELFRFGHPSRRQDCNRLHRIAVQNEIDEEAKIAEWVQLGEYAFARPVAPSDKKESTFQSPPD